MFCAMEGHKFGQGVASGAVGLAEVGEHKVLLSIGLIGGCYQRNPRHLGPIPRQVESRLIWVDHGSHQSGLRHI